jgi:hypothetical protein
LRLGTSELERGSRVYRFRFERGVCGIFFRPLTPLSILEQLRNGMAFVGVGAAQSVRLVCADAVKDRVALRALANFRVNLERTNLSVRFKAVKAVGKPVVCAIMEHRDWAEINAGFEGVNVFVYGVVVNACATLRAAIGADGSQFQVFNHVFLRQ